MKLAAASGDIRLDRADWAGITASNPFPPLPANFEGGISLSASVSTTTPPKKKSHRQNRLHLPLQLSEPKEKQPLRGAHKTQLGAAAINIMSPKR